MSRNKFPPKKFKQEAYKKTFFRPTNKLIRAAEKLIGELCGSSNQEKLGNFELIYQSEGFSRAYPGYVGKDVARIVRHKLGYYV